jgi:phosphopantothenoylcysteine synthetase/decarboxylase
MNASTDNPLRSMRLLLCVTGGIACYKSADLTSKLVQAGATVNVAMTASAGEFIRPLTFEALTHGRVYQSLWEATERHDSTHLSLTESADLMVIAPATANMLAKMAHGLADDLVSTLALSACGACDILVTPAMNTRMWEAPATQANMTTLRERGVQVVGPGEGNLACGTTGVGRMADVPDILTAITNLLEGHTPKHPA